MLLDFADSIEVGNNKKALQEADKVLKKSPGIQCARALKALALLRIGRDEEAQPIVNQIANEKPFDEQTLQVMSFCYKEQEQCEYAIFIFFPNFYRPFIISQFFKWKFEFGIVYAN